MAGNRSTSVEWHSLADVMQGYDLHTAGRDEVYYSVMHEKVPKFTYTGGDVVQGRELLEQSLQPVIANGVTATYTLRFHPALDKDGAITNATPYDASANFRLNDYATGMSGTRQVQPADNSPILQRMVEILERQEKRLTELEQTLQPSDDGLIDDIEEVEEEEEPEEFAWMAGVQKFEQVVQQSPLLSDAMAYMRLGIRAFAKKMGIDDPIINQGNYQQPATAMAGTTQHTMDETTQQAPPVDMRIVMRDLVAGFPELPNLLAQLHHVQQTDPDLFTVAKKKLINGVNQLME